MGAALNRTAADRDWSTLAGCIRADSVANGRRAMQGKGKGRGNGKAAAACAAAITVWLACAACYGVLFWYVGTKYDVETHTAAIAARNIVPSYGQWKAMLTTVQGVVCDARAVLGAYATPEAAAEAADAAGLVVNGSATYYTAVGHADQCYMARWSLDSHRSHMVGVYGAFAACGFLFLGCCLTWKCCDIVLDNADTDAAWRTITCRRCVSCAARANTIERPAPYEAIEYAVHVPVAMVVRAPPIVCDGLAPAMAAAAGLGADTCTQQQSHGGNRSCYI